MKQLVLALVLSVSSAFAIGDALKVYSVSSEGGIWDHGYSTYIVTTIPGFNKDKSIWGGFQLQSENEYSGVIVTDQFV